MRKLGPAAARELRGVLVGVGWGGVGRSLTDPVLLPLGRDPAGHGGDLTPRRGCGGAAAVALQLFGRRPPPRAPARPGLFRHVPPNFADSARAVAPPRCSNSLPPRPRPAPAPPAVTCWAAGRAAVRVPPGAAPAPPAGRALRPGSASEPPAPDSELGRWRPRAPWGLALPFPRSAVSPAGLSPGAGFPGAIPAAGAPGLRWRR